MDCVSQKSEITHTFHEVRNFSFAEKKSTSFDEEGINAFLDAIIDFKAALSAKSDRVNDINERIEKLTWFNNLNDECLLLINDLISAMKDLRTSLIRQYVAMDILRKKGIAKEDIKRFKHSIDDLREAYEDLESVFFYLPEMPDFVETTRRISLIG